VVCIGNTATYTTIGTFELDRVLGKHGQFAVQVYDSEMGAWTEPETRKRADLVHLGLNVEGQGFRIVRLRTSS
jgi:hypothetical protein